MSGDIYRPLIRADCDAIALHYNRNLAEPDPLWCAGGRRFDGNRIWLHRLTLWVRGRGGVIVQLHERNGRFVSYFGGYAKGDEATFSIGVVDLDLPDPLDVWRSDLGRLFESTLAAGARTFTIRASSDRARFVDWMEREVGMKRPSERCVWTADRESIASYVGGFPQWADPPPDRGSETGGSRRRRRRSTEKGVPGVVEAPEGLHR